MWLHNRKISRLEHVRSLPKILKDDDAKEIFLKKGSKEALKVVNRPSLEELFAKLDLEELLEAIKTKIDGMTFEDTRNLRDRPGSMRSTLSETCEIIDEFSKSVFGE